MIAAKGSWTLNRPARSSAKAARTWVISRSDALNKSLNPSAVFTLYRGNGTGFLTPGSKAAEGTRVWEISATTAAVSVIEILPDTWVCFHRINSTAWCYFPRKTILILLATSIAALAIQGTPEKQKLSFRTSLPTPRPVNPSVDKCSI